MGVLGQAKGRIALLGAVMTFVFLTLLAIATRVIVRQRTFADLDDELMTLSTALASDLELRGTEGFEYEELRAGVEANVLVFRLEHHNAILLLDGRIVAVTGDIAQRVTLGSVAAVLRPGEQPFTEAEPFTGQKRLCRFRVVHLGGGARGGILIVFRPIDRFIRMLMRIDVALVAIVLLGSFASALVLVFAVRRALVPVERITSVAESLQASDLPSRVPESGAEEFRHLAGVINSLLDRIDRAFQSQKRLVADAAHELKTPVAVILAEAQQALRDRDDGLDPSESLEGIVGASRAMAREVDDLLLLARGEASASEDGEEIDLGIVARQVVDSVAAMASQREIDIDIDGAGVRIVANEGSIHRMLANLVSNAIHYSAPGGDVSIAIRRTDDKAIVDVADRGPGIRPEDRRRIFDRFVRLPSTRRLHQEGSGLGLAIVDQIVARNHGRIDVLEREGGGSIFRVSLPLG